jgi:carbon-monoxide dehydrogenase large subunit
LFVDDVQRSDMAFAAFLRSPYAHARLQRIDADRARALPGVLGVFTAADLGDYWKPAPLLVSPPPIERLTFHERTQVPLVKDKVRHAGEPIALVVASTRYLAEDAAALIDVDYEPLPAVVDLEQALLPGAALVHEDLGTNLAAHVIQEKGSYEQARPRADLVLRRRFSYNHGLAAAMENRGVVAAWDPRSQRLTIWDTTQAPIPIRNGLASMLGLSEHQVRVIAPFIGGGFGPKIMMFYPEEILIPWAAMRLGAPVKWIEDRAENFVATTHERGQIHDAEIALTRDGIILGVRDEFLHDTGAYDPYGLTVPINSQCTLLGPYNIPHYYSDFKAVFTNKTIVTPYRGAGRQHGVFVIERLLDLAARELGLAIPEIRRRNLLAPGSFPHDNQIIYQDFAPLVYDSGNYEPVLDRALEMIGYNRFRSGQGLKPTAPGRRVGIGVVCYVEGTGIGPYEGARVQIQSSGKVSVSTGVGTQGQGHFTSFAQIVADQLGVDVQDVEVITGDTDMFHWGTGTFASRGAVVAGNAVFEAAKKVREKALSAACQELDVPVGDLELAHGHVRDRRSPYRAIELGELARRSNPLRGAVRPGSEPGLEATEYYGPDRGATSSGAHAMIVEVDPETLQIYIPQYVVVHDCGTVINPLILEGQVHGGVAQGIGNSYYEELLYDENGQLLNASFMDYLLPTALEAPVVSVGHEETRSPINPLGIKGAGEAGAIPVGALFAQAIEDAFPELRLEILEIPLSPSRLWDLLIAAPRRSPTKANGD